MKKITFCNSKGGVGKTTLTINVAQILAQIGKRILLFDFDPQANLTNTLLDNPIDKNGISKWILGADKDTLIETIVETKISGIFLVPSYSKMVLETNNIVLNQPNSEFRFKMNLEEMKNILNSKFDYVFFDTYPSMNTILLNVLLASDEIIVPIEPHSYSFEGITTMFKPYLETINNSKKMGMNIKNNMNYYVLNKIQKNKLHQSVFELISQNEIGKKLLDTHIPLSATKQKETMLLKFAAITEKNPIYKLVMELTDKGVI